jgi:hypothetical protein
LQALRAKVTLRRSDTASFLIAQTEEKTPATRFSRIHFVTEEDRALPTRTIEQTLRARENR